MGEAGQRVHAVDDTEHTIRRSPDLQVVSARAKVRYVCDWTGPGREPTVGSDGYWGPRDGVRWYSYSDQPPRGFLQRQVKVGPVSPAWARTWDEDPGQYTVVAEIRSRLSAPGAAPRYCYQPQQVGDAGAMLKDWLDALLKKGEGPSPDDAERGIRRYRVLLDEVSRRHPPHDAGGAKEHEQTVDKWRELAGRLRGLLSSTDGRRRIPVRAMHLDTATQARRPLSLFLAQLDDAHHPRPGGAIAQKRWILVDWTDPGDPRFRGTYEGEGDDARQAIEDALRSWDWGNRYPPGSLTFEIPPALQGVVGGSARRQLDTNGKSLTEELIVVFEWIAIGTMLVAGFSFIFVSIPALASGAMATSMLASTAGAVFSAGQRWRDGIFDWKADALDGLTVVGNLVGAGAWARGAGVRVLGKAGTKLDYVFVGARVGTDAAQGVLIIASRIDEVTTLMKDPALPPEERARRMLALFAQMTAAGLMAALSFRASATEAKNLRTKPRILADDPRANVPDEQLRNLTDPTKTIDRTAPPVAEGHTREGQHRTVVNTGVARARQVLEPAETDFSKAYPDDKKKWLERKFDRKKILLLDHEGFTFKAHCKGGTLEITIVTKDENGRYSKHLFAKDLYPRMYEYFDQVGNPVKRLDGLWAWDNYDTARKKYDELIAKGVSERAAVKEAVLHAKSYLKYHKRMGFTKVVRAEHYPDQVFSFVIERPNPQEP